MERMMLELIMIVYTNKKVCCKVVVYHERMKEGKESSTEK